MCLSKDQVVPVLVEWGTWQWKNAGYGENLGYSSDGNMHSDHLATAACGGGGKVEQFDDMPESVSMTHDSLSLLSIDDMYLCKMMFFSQYYEDELSLKARIGYAKPFYLKKVEINSRMYTDRVKAFWGAVGVALDSVKKGQDHPMNVLMREKRA